MTFLEALLIMAVVALGVQLLLIQRHYDEKLADQATIIGYIISQTSLDIENPQRINDIRDKLFNSSQ